MPDFMQAKVCEELVRRHKQQTHHSSSFSTHSTSPTIWRTLREALRGFMRAMTQQRLPPRFNETLQATLHENGNLRAAFAKKGVLFYWQHEEERLAEPWDLQTVHEALSVFLPHNSAVSEVEGGVRSATETKSPLSTRHQPPRNVVRGSRILNFQSTTHRPIRVREDFPEWMRLTGGALTRRTMLDTQLALLSSSSLSLPPKLNSQHTSTPPPPISSSTTFNASLFWA